MNSMIWNTLRDSTIKDGVIHLSRGLSEEEHKLLCKKLRNDLIDGRIPFYKPIAVRIATSNLKRVINMDKNTDRSYLGMIPALNSAIIMPEHTPDSFPGTWLDRDIETDKIFNPTNKAKGNLISPDSRIYVRSFDNGPQYVESFKFALDKKKYGISLSSECCSPLIKDEAPIIYISENETSPVVLEMVYAISTGVIDYIDIDFSLRIIKKPYLPIRQVYNLSNYISVSLLSDDTSTINLTYMVGINEDVLQCIIKRYAECNLKNLEESEE